MAAKTLTAAFTLVFSLAGAAFAAHPLITDDTATQRKGNTQLEFIGEYGHDSEDGIATNSLVVPTIPVLSYGIADTADLVLGISYQRIETKQNGVTTTERDLGHFHPDEMEIL